MKSFDISAIKNDPTIIYQMVNSYSRRSFYFFLKEFIHITIKEEVVWNWHIEYLCNRLQEIGEQIIRKEEFDKEYLIINIPPGSTKSTIVSQFFPIWLWINDPELTIITISYSQDVAVRHALRSRDVLRAEYFKECFDIKLRRDFSGKKGYGNIMGGARLVSSIGGSVTSDHADIIIIDDPHNVEQAASEAERKSANDFIRSTLPTRKKNKKTCPIVVVMQRLHEEDATGMIITEMPGMSSHICLPAELSDDVKPEELKEKYIDGLLDPVRLDRQVLNSQSKSLGSYNYAGQFSQRPAPAEGGILKRKYFKIIDPSNVPAVTVNFVADTAYTKNEKNDPCAFMAYSIINGDLYIRDVFVKHLEFHDQIKQIPIFCEKNNYNASSRVEVEPKASGKDVVSTLRNGTNMNIKESANPTKDKEARVKDVEAPIEAGRTYLVRGGWNETFLDECASFPNGKHDDQVDCLVMAANRAFKKKGLKYY